MFSKQLSQYIRTNICSASHSNENESWKRLHVAIEAGNFLYFFTNKQKAAVVVHCYCFGIILEYQEMKLKFNSCLKMAPIQTKLTKTEIRRY